MNMYQTKYYKEVHRKAIRLREGGTVEINGNYFSAETLPSDFDDSPCYDCNVDCLCRGEVCDVCNEMDSWPGNKNRLHLIS